MNTFRPQAYPPHFVGRTHLTRQGAAVAPTLVHTGKAVQQVDPRHAHVAEPDGAVVDTIQTHLHGPAAVAAAVAAVGAAIVLAAPAGTTTEAATAARAP